MVVDIVLWNSLSETKRLNETDVQKIKDDTTKEVTSSVHAAKNAEIGNIKHSYEMQLALAKKDIENLTREVNSLKEEKASFTKQLELQNINLVRVAEATRPMILGQDGSKK